MTNTKNTHKTHDSKSEKVEALCSENSTDDKAKFISAWNSQVDTFGSLRWTPSYETSEKVQQAMDNLKQLVQQVADEKWEARKSPIVSKQIKSTWEVSQ